MGWALYNGKSIHEKAESTQCSKNIIDAAKTRIKVHHEYGNVKPACL